MSDLYVVFDDHITQIAKNEWIGREAGGAPIYARYSELRLMVWVGGVQVMNEEVTAWESNDECPMDYGDVRDALQDLCESQFVFLSERDCDEIDRAHGLGKYRKE